MGKKRIAFHTFGCKLNFSEASLISRQMSTGSYEITDFRDIADIYVINSCAVTAAAERKCRQAIRQAKKRNPEASIVVTGCYAQLRPQEIALQDGVNLILGTSNKFQLPALLDNIENLDAPQTYVSDILKDHSFTTSYSLTDRTRSFMKIQDGCDYFCSYCTIPFARGLSRSALIKDVIETATEIGKTEIKEIVLTGINIGDFGRKNKESFLDLLKELDQVEGIARIRISSIEPDLLTGEIIDFVAASRKFQPHFHIPLQSGSNKILGIMKRRYKRELFADHVMKIKGVMPHCCIAADVIVGFPGETEEDFMESYGFIKDLDITYVHAFSYSERPNTAAISFPGKVQPEKIRNRTTRLLALSNQKKLAFYNNNTGKTFKVLFEVDPNKGYLYGFTENYIRVKTPYDKELINEIIAVKLEEMDEEGNYVFRERDG